MSDKNKMPEKGKKKSVKSAVGRIAEYMESGKWFIVVALVLAAFGAVLTIIGPDKIGQIATILSNGLTGGIDLEAIAKIGVFLIAIYLLSWLFGFIQHYIMSAARAYEQSSHDCFRGYAVCGLPYNDAYNRMAARARLHRRNACRNVYNRFDYVKIAKIFCRKAEEPG